MDFRSDAVPAGGREDDLFFSCARACEYIRDTTRGGRSLVGWVGPGTIIQNYNYITTVFYNLKNLNNIINIIIFFHINSKPF